MTPNTTADTTAKTEREGGVVEAVGWPMVDADGHLDFDDAQIRPEEADIKHLPVGCAYVPVYSQAAIDTLRAQLEAAELRDAQMRDAAKLLMAQLEAAQETLSDWVCEVLEREERAIARAEAAEAEVARLRVDAERYRWLRDDRNYEKVRSMISILNYGEDAYLLDMADLDAAIDVARTKEAAP